MTFLHGELYKKIIMLRYGHHIDRWACEGHGEKGVKMLTEFHRIWGCSNLCSNSKELRCQCLQIPKEIVENCNQTYFKTGISKLDRHGEAILLKRRLKAMTKINRIEISKEEYSKLGPKCIPEVSPLMFLDELGRLFEGLSTLQQKK
ncbi:hypothetical protein DPEC_G00023910 [Dallia pectoralis]|uniref:Uncharacterized protein n=1 Tax=Dallia pectoralis TaxID=75939 RepID=A0ACC2HGW8_DALPE|nr:hypothetical protein DPEC_G00023910 [Dallia pectoralis]